MNGIAAMLQEIAATTLRQQVIHEGDYVDADGLLVCGKCGKHRQDYQLFRSPENEGEKVKTKVAVLCQCEEAEKLNKEEAAQREKDLKIVEELRRTSLMDKRFQRAKFERFNVDATNEDNYKICMRYATAFSDMMKKNQGLLMWGGVGTGKTFAAACIANYLLDHKVPVVMTSFVKVLSALQEHNDLSDFLSKLRRARLVIFDDLGAERNTSFALEKVYEIVNDRYNAQLPMIYTTNLTLEEMQNELDTRYSRIYDRIFECCYPMQFTGTSWRKEKAYTRIQEMEKLLKGETE